ncbi:hypothetical protein HCY52_08365 [Acinetobacter radioresistens]|uniref:hypothetical protein n=1 Tax=Acinetobacter radioresistens TaxID=40216 RepID=UPI0020040B81|nr:hypothetical protein [Acinetobacter radioresistens]MCK4083829.1 hypothetical protein [Acinetobacter radioresistens]
MMQIKVKRKKIAVLIALIGGIGFSSNLMAKSLGIYGETYPVVEVSFIEALQAKIQKMVDNGDWEKYKQKYIKDTMDGFKRPKGFDLPHAVSSQTRYFDPSIILEMDMRLPDGTYLARKGDYINPLKNQNMSSPLIFIDGDEEKQVKWALQKRLENPRAYIVLVKGNWYELSVKNKTKFWFDQTGEFINRMGIERTPSYVSQDNLRLRIDEVGL